MAAGSRIVIAGQAAGFASLFGQIAKANGDTLNIPEGTLNIGGNGEGFILDALSGWDPLDHTDGSFAALELGDDIYIYAVRDYSGIATLVASKNSTVPTGATAEESRKIGGFHVGRHRPISERFNAAFVPGVQILSNSCWDLQHRPVASPEGMAEFMPGKWGSIYQLSRIAGDWPNEVYGSRYNATPVRDTGGYVREDLYRGMVAAGMRRPLWEEWKAMAYGAPQGNDGNNDTAWTATSNNGPTTTGAVAKSVSCLGFVDTVGNLWEQLDGNYDRASGPWVWDSSAVNVGKDSSFGRGQVYRDDWRQCVAGGPYDHGQRCGASTLSTNSTPWGAGGHVTVRGVSESI
jgi:hypothetical protein